MKHYDIIVVGGGFSGCAAAISAARQGMKVCLCEAGGSLGGAAVNCLVNPFMNWKCKQPDGSLLDLSQGIFKEIIDNLSAIGGLHETRSSVFHEEYLKLVLDRMVLEAGVELLFHATLCETVMDGEKIVSAGFYTKSGIISLSAECYIDCSGDGDLAFLSGAPMRLGRPEDNLCQPMTLCFRVANVDTEMFFSKESRELMQELYHRAQTEGRTSNPRENVLVFHDPVDGVVHFNTTRIVKCNPVDAFDLSKAEVEGRKQAYELFCILKKDLPAFKNAQFLFSASQIGVRESRMLDGDFVLNAEDIISCTHFEDGIAACNYDIDIHNPSGSGTYIRSFGPGEYYTIPYRCLIPRKVSNLLVAGRCISVSHEVQASCRIMPTVCSIGEAAGIGAVVAVKTSVIPQNADTALIRKLLSETGAFIG